MDWKGREQSQNVEDRRGSRGGGGGGKTLYLVVCQSFYTGLSQATV